MATYTITTPTNIDALTAKAGADIYNINGGTLTIDQDTRYGIEQNTSALLGTVTLSATLGGDLLIDDRLVRLIYFTGGSGNVPAYGTIISKGAASGKLAAVYANLGSAPTTPGAAMPTSGYIKIRQWNSTPYTAGALTGISATVDIDPIAGVAGDRNGFIEVVGQEATTVSVNGLSQQGTNKLVKGTPFLIGTTPGTPARSDTYQIPTNGNTCWMPGVFVENTAGVGDYEFWPTTSDAALITKIDTDQYRGRYCWVDTNGVLRFGSDGTNSTGGCLPAANCRIVIGSVILNMATSAAKTVNSMNTTPNSRYRWNMGGLANLEIEWCTHNWRITTNLGKKTNAQNSGVFQPVSIQQSGEKVYWENCGVGGQLSDSSICFDLVTCALGGEFRNVTFGKGAFPVTNIQNFRCNASDNVYWENCRFTHTGDKISVSNHAILTLSSSNIELNNNILASNFNASTGSNFHLHDNEYYYSAYGLPRLVANLIPAWNMATISNYLIENESFPLANTIGAKQLPTSALVNTSINSSDFIVRNIGSYASPIDASGYTEIDAAYARVGAVVTITTLAPHGARVGDKILIFLADSTGAPASSRTITGVTTNTITFTGVNSGLTNGFVSFYVSYMDSIVTIGGNNVTRGKFQNIWIHGTNAQTISINSATYDIQFDNFDTDRRYVAHFAIAGSDIRFRSFGFNTAIPSPGAGVLGTLMESVFTTPLTTTDKVAQNWNRVSSLVTFTVPNHGLASGDYIQLYDSTNPTGVANGWRSVLVTSSSTFTVGGSNTGSTSGTASYRISNARLNVFMNDESAGQPFVTIDSGTPRFTGSGTLAALNPGDGVTWETPDWIYAFDNFANMLMVMSSSTNVIQHFNISYALDRGAGYSAFKNLYYQRPGGGGSSASTTVTMTSTTGVNVGDYVYGLGIADGAKVVSITNATDIVVSVANIGAVSGVLIFNQAPNETAFPTTGVKMKIRILAFGTPAAAITYISIPMLSTATTQQNLYPQDVETVSFGLTNIATGSIVALYDSTDTELQREVVTDGTFDYQYVHSGVDTTGNYAVVWHEDYYTLKYDNLTFSTTDQSIFVVQEEDLAYIPSSTDISTFDYSNKIHILDPTVSSGAQVDISLPQLYSNWKDNITLADNFTYDFAYVVVGGQVTFGSQSVSLYFFQDNGWKMRPKEINHTATLLEGILIAESGAPIVPTIGSYNVFLDYQKPEHALTIALAGALTPTDIANLSEGVWSDSTQYDPGEKGNDLKTTLANVLSNG